MFASNPVMEVVPKRYGVALRSLPPIETLQPETLKDFTKEDLRCYLEAAGMELKYMLHMLSVVLLKNVCETDARVLRREINNKHDILARSLLDASFGVCDFVIAYFSSSSCSTSNNVTPIHTTYIYSIIIRV